MADIATMTVDQLRTEYAAIAKRAISEHRCTAAEFKAKASALLKDSIEATPADWVRAALRVTFKCRRCAGTGRFITGSLNGKPTGPGGECFRCQGNGTQADADLRRNYGYDVNAVNRAAREMMG